MICRNCGLQNAPGRVHCGSCGDVLEAEAEELAADDSGALEDTVITPSAQPRPVRRSRSQAVPVEPPQGVPGSRRQPPAVVCRNCGRANNPNRSVCYQCGRRLVVTAALRAQRGRDDEASGARAIAFAASALVVVLAVSAAGLLFGGVLLGGGPASTATPLAAATDVALEPSDAPPVMTPTARPTLAPRTAVPASTPTVAEPTVAPSTAPTAAPSAPPPTPVNCSGSSVETAWLNLTRDDSRHRLAPETTWCVHRVVITPYYGRGTIRLQIDGEPVAEARHAAGATQSEYAFEFPAPLVVPSRSTLRYAFACAARDCAAVIQVGYDAISTP